MRVPARPQPRHEPHSAILSYGALRILNDGGEKRLAVYGGQAIIEDDVLTILTDGAEWPEEIDLTRAKSDRTRARQRIQERTNDIELQNDQVLLRRALVQIEVSSHSLGEEDE